MFCIETMPLVWFPVVQVSERRKVIVFGSRTTWPKSWDAPPCHRSWACPQRNPAHWLIWMMRYRKPRLHLHNQHSSLMAHSSPMSCLTPVRVPSYVFVLWDVAFVYTSCMHCRYAYSLVYMQALPLTLFLLTCVALPCCRLDPFASSVASSSASSQPVTTASLASSQPAAQDKLDPFDAPSNWCPSPQVSSSGTVELTVLVSFRFLFWIITCANDCMRLCGIWLVSSVHLFLGMLLFCFFFSSPGSTETQTSASPGMYTSFYF